MSLETLTGSTTYLDDLNPANPVGTDAKQYGDDHIRGIKNVLLNTFPNLSAEASMAAEDLNFLKGLTAKGVTNKLIAGNSDSHAIALSVGAGLSMNISASNITAKVGSGLSISSGIIVADIDRKTFQTADGSASYLFSGIPNWSKRITVIMENLGLNDSASYLIQVGTAGGLVSSNYKSTSAFFDHTNGSGGDADSAGFMVYLATDGSNVTGIMELFNIAGNKWVSAHKMASVDGLFSIVGSGFVSLSGDLTQLRVTTDNADSASMDIGFLNVLCE